MKNLLILMAALMLFTCKPGGAAELFATVESLSGSAFVSAPSGQRSDIAVGQQIYEKQTISTAADSEVHLETVDGGIVAIRRDTVFRVDEYQADGSSEDRIFMSLLKGAIRSITGWIGKHNAPAYRITTPTATIGIRGTDHETTVIEEADGDEPGTYDMVNEGITVLKTPYGESEVTAEKFAFAPRYRAVAPFFLVQKPAFWAKRKLKIEERIEKRKASLRSRIEQIREERIKRLEKLRSKRPAQARGKTKSGKEQARTRADRKKQVEQRRNKTKLKEAGPQRAKKPGSTPTQREKRKETAPDDIREKPERRPEHRNQAPPGLGR